jgi:hypothetical protein
MPIKKNVNKKFFKKWSHNMAYVLGLLCADGSIRHSNRNAWYIDLQLTDEVLVNGVRKVMKSEHKITVRKRIPPENDLFRLQIGSKEMCQDLAALGIVPNKTKVIKLPDVPRKYFGDFVRGYFDGDGNVWVGKNHVYRDKSETTIMSFFTSCSRAFLEDLRRKFKERNISSSIIRFRSGTFFRLQISVKGSILLYQLMYKTVKSGLYLNRKKNKFEQFIKLRE